MKKTDERLNEKEKIKRKKEKEKRSVHLGTKRFGHFLYDEGITEEKSIQPWVAIKLFNVEVSEWKREMQTDERIKQKAKDKKETETETDEQKERRIKTEEQETE